MTQATDNRAARGAVGDGGAPSAVPGRPGPLARLASVRLTLWLLAILALAMSAATVIPQNAPDGAYARAFGTAVGPLIAKSALRNVYGSWWFIGAFALLAVSLLACVVERVGRLLHADRELLTKVTPDRVSAQGRQARLRCGGPPGEAVEVLTGALRRSGYWTRIAPGETGAQRGLVARRGRWAPWIPVVVHVGMVIILVGAAWGRLPRNSYRTVAALQSGDSFQVKPPGNTFGLRLLGAGAKRDEKGQATGYWAKVEVLEEGKVVASQVVSPNHPLRHRGVSVVLQSLLPGGYEVEVSRGDYQGHVPVAFAPDGAVDMMGTIHRLEDPPWIVFIHDFRGGESDQEGPQARVFVDRSGALSHNWQLVGWVGEEGTQVEGVRFRLVRAGEGAQLSLDRDVGVPIVYLGFLVIALGSALILGGRRATVLALATEKGEGSHVLVGISRSVTETEGEKLIAALSSALADARETKARPGSEVLA